MRLEKTNRTYFMAGDLVSVVSPFTTNIQIGRLAHIHTSANTWLCRFDISQGPRYILQVYSGIDGKSGSFGLSRITRIETSLYEELFELL